MFGCFVVLMEFGREAKSKVLRDLTVFSFLQPLEAIVKELASGPSMDRL